MRRSALAVSGVDPAPTGLLPSAAAALEVTGMS